MTGEMDANDNPDNWRSDLADLIREKKAERELLKKIRESDGLASLQGYYHAIYLDR